MIRDRNGPPENAVQVREVNHRVEPPPERVIEFDLSLENRLDRSLAVLRTWNRCRFNGVDVATGDYAKIHANTGGYRAIAAGAQSAISLRVPLSREALEKVETRRTDDDLEYQLTSELTVALIQDGQPPILGAPWLARATRTARSTNISGEIPRSKWIDYLSQMGWEETLIVEIPAQRLRGRSPGAVNRYKEALDLHRQGNYRKALAACRDAFEALAWRYSEKEADRPDMKMLRKYFDDTEKGDRLDAILERFQRFLHLGRHEQAADKGIEINREDSLFALHLTAGMLRYIETS